MAKLKKDGTPKKSGGVRKNQNGRPTKYGEPTASLKSFRVPISKKIMVEKTVQAMLDEWAK